MNDEFNFKPIIPIYYKKNIVRTCGVGISGTATNHNQIKIICFPISISTGNSKKTVVDSIDKQIEIVLNNKRTETFQLYKYFSNAMMQ